VTKENGPETPSVKKVREGVKIQKHKLIRDFFFFSVADKNENTTQPEDQQGNAPANREKIVKGKNFL
jgi:hypothetical protein